MFGRQQGNGNGSGAPPPQSMEQNDVPPLRKFLVRRLEPRNNDIIEEFTIEAHEVELNANGNLLRFIEGVYDPAVNGCRARVRRCFNGWIDYEEIFVPTLPDSGIIMPPSSLTM